MSQQKNDEIMKMSNSILNYNQKTQRSEGSIFQGMKGLQEVVNKYSTSELLSGTFLSKIIAKYLFEKC